MKKQKTFLMLETSRGHFRLFSNLSLYIFLFVILAFLNIFISMKFIYNKLHKKIIKVVYIKNRKNYNNINFKEGQKRLLGSSSVKTDH